MADKQLTVKIEGKDNLSPIFKKLGTEAAAASKQMTAGAKSAEKSLDDLAKSTQQAEQRAKSLESANRAIGVGFAALGASIGLYSREIINNQQAVATLERTYGTAANGLQDFANQIQQTTIYSSEQAIQAENLFGTLVRNYGLSVAQVQQLVTISTDLAATSGLTLEDTAMRVQAAIRGEAESAEALGLTMNQQAIDRNNLTLTMSNQEAAQYRLNALIEQSSFAQGAASAQADTTAGKVQQLTNRFDDAARGAIGLLGPLPDVVAGLSHIGLETGLAISGVGSLVKGLGQLALALKGVTAAETAAGTGGMLSGLGSALGVGGAGGGLAAALGATATAALSLTAAFTPLIATLIIAQRQADETMDTISGQTDAIDAWSKWISDPDLRQNYIYLAQDIRDFNVAVQDMNTGQVVDITDALDELLSLNPGDLAKVTEILHANGIEIGNLDPNNIEQLTIVYNTLMQVYAEHVAYAQQIAEVEQSHQQAVTDLTEQYGPLTDAVTESTQSFSELSETGQRSSATLTTLRDIVDSNGETASRTAGEYQKLAAAIEHVGKFAELDLGLAQTVTRSYDAWRGETQALAISHDKLNESLAGGTDELAAYIDAANKAAQSIGLLSTNAQLFQAAGIKAPSLDVAVNLQTGQGAFDAVFGAIKQAQSMSQSIGGAKSWADELIGDPGTWSELDKLLAEGRINVDQYNAAQAAQVRISEDVTNAQRDLLAVQANLAPTLADAVRQQAEYIGSLQDLTPEQQLAALGFMDTAESAKAMQLAQLAAASSTKEMQASTTTMITEMAKSDPVLKQMLLQMGLISEGADGTITVNYDEANSATTAMNNLTESIDALIIALGGIPPIHTSSNAKDTQKDVSGLTDEILGIPDSHTTTITAVNNVSGAVLAAVGDLAAIDGKVVTTYIDTVYRQIGPTPAATGTTISAMATGGTMTADIPRYAIGGTHGGSYAIVGDGGGPEMVWLPTGAQVTNAVATRSKRESIEARRGGDINIYGPMTLNPAGSDAYAAIQQEMMGGVRR